MDGMNPIPESELSAIEAYCNAATQGPWDFEDDSGCWYVHNEFGDEVTADLMELRDAKFTAKARTDLPKLLAAYREAMKDVERMNRLSAMYHITPPHPDKRDNITFGQIVYTDYAAHPTLREAMDAMAGKEKA